MREKEAMRQKNRIGASLLFILVCVTIFAASAFAETSTQVNGSDETLTFDLSCSEKNVAVSENKREVHFYADGDIDCTSVKLYDGSGNFLAAMLDDGNRNVTGDNSADDDIYSAIVFVDVAKKGTLSFYAQAYLDDGTEVRSDTVDIGVLDGFSAEDLLSMEEVDGAIDEMTSDAEYKAMDESGKKEMAEKLLTEQAHLGNVVSDSLHYSSEGHIYTFQYSCGVLGGICFEDFEEEAAETLPEEAETIPDIPIVGSIGASQTELAGANTAVNGSSQGNAVIYYGFEAARDSWALPLWNGVLDTWRDNGFTA